MASKGAFGGRWLQAALARRRRGQPVRGVPGPSFGFRGSLKGTLRKRFILAKC